MKSGHNDEFLEERIEQRAILDMEVAIDQAGHEATRTGTDFPRKAADNEVKRQEAKEEVGMLQTYQVNLTYHMPLNQTSSARC